jgi:hypothetical protein
MELEPIGRLEDVDELDLGPIVVPIVGYKNTTKGNVEVITKIRFKRRPPFKYLREKIAQGLDTTSMVGDDQVDFLTVIVDDEDKQKFLDLIFSEEIYVDYVTIRDVFKKVTETYAQRPTKQPSGSSNGPSPTKRTTGRAASLEASTTKRSRSATG